LLLLISGCEYFSVLVKDDPDSRSYIEGTLVDSLTGKPLAGITAQIDNATAVTSNAGYFKLTNIPTGHHTISFFSEGFSSRTAAANVSLSHDSISRFTLLDLRPKVDSFIVSLEFIEKYFGKLRLSLFDPDSNMNQISVNWGDGNTVNYPGNYNTPVTSYIWAGHTYNVAGIYDVIIKLLDKNEEYTFSSFPVTVNTEILPEIGAVYLNPDTLRIGSPDSLYLYVRVVNIKDYVKSIEINYKYADYTQLDTTTGSYTIPLRDPPDRKYVGYPEGVIGPEGTIFTFTIPTSILPFDSPPLDTNIIRIKVLDGENKSAFRDVYIAKFPY
jgi:hypothetical protein